MRYELYDKKYVICDRKSPAVLYPKNHNLEWVYPYGIFDYDSFCYPTKEKAMATIFRYITTLNYEILPDLYLGIIDNNGALCDVDRNIFDESSLLIKAIIAQSKDQSEGVIPLSLKTIYLKLVNDHDYNAFPHVLIMRGKEYFELKQSTNSFENGYNFVVQPIFIVSNYFFFDDKDNAFKVMLSQPYQFTYINFVDLVNQVDEEYQSLFLKANTNANFYS